MTPRKAPGTQQALNKYLGTSPCAGLPLHATLQGAPLRKFHRQTFSGSKGRPAHEAGQPVSAASAGLGTCGSPPAIPRGCILPLSGREQGPRDGPHRGQRRLFSWGTTGSSRTAQAAKSFGGKNWGARGILGALGGTLGVAGRAGHSGGSRDRLGALAGGGVMERLRSRGMLGAVPQSRREDAEERGPAARETEVRRL